MLPRSETTAREITCTSTLAIGQSFTREELDTNLSHDAPRNGGTGKKKNHWSGENKQKSEFSETSNFHLKLSF